jgi:hypothetical protein
MYLDALICQKTMARNRSPKDIAPSICRARDAVGSFLAIVSKPRNRGVFQTSDFGIHSAFGIRVSDFKAPHFVFDTAGFGFSRLFRFAR